MHRGYPEAVGTLLIATLAEDLTSLSLIASVLPEEIAEGRMRTCLCLSCGKGTVSGTWGGLGEQVIHLTTEAAARGHHVFPSNGDTPADRVSMSL